MKKFTSFMAALAAVSMSAFAADLQPEVIALGNADFETTGEKENEDGTTSAKGKGDKLEEGWSQVTVSDNVFSYCNYNKAHSEDADLVAHEGSWYVRCVNTNSTIPAGTYIYQDVERPGKGVYALTADVVVSRNSCKGGLTDANYAFLFLGDTDSDIDDPEDPGFLKIFQTNAMTERLDENGQPVYNEDGTVIMDPIQDYSRKTVRVVFDSQAKRGDLTVAFGIPTTSADFSKGWLECDTFVLEYFGADATVDEVNEYYGATAVETVAAAPVNNKIYNIQGVEVKEATAPGIYIQNGKKFIVK